MRHNRQLFIDIIDDVLRRLPNQKEGVDCYELWNAIPNIRRAKRIDAYCFEKRRGPRCRRSEAWLDLQASNYEKTKV
jgi:hypothetical protein